MPPKPVKISKKDLEQIDILRKMEASPLFFIGYTWGLTPQPVAHDYQDRFELGLKLTGKAWDAFCKTVTPEWFEPYIDGRHVTWQQYLVLYGVEKALRKEIPMRVSIVSGHGIGKSSMIAWLILWFLWVHVYSQVACTSPSKEQMYDVLWKELKKWIDKMEPGMAAMYVWESSHIRMKEAQETWFARAKTSSKENTEALAGVHADWVLIAVDEASGVEEPIFNTMEGALTSGNTLVFVISNGTRNIGYFYETHHSDAARWQNYSFSSLDSPRVDYKYVDGIASKHGEDSTEYAIRVKGEFPDQGQMDDKGYVQLFNKNILHFVPYDKEWKPVGRRIGALDASGEGQDSSEWAIRTRQRAAILHTERISTPKTMASKSVTLCDAYWIDPIDFVIDSFGSGSDVGMEIALMTSQEKRPWRVTPINVGEPCDDEGDKELYMNKRAEMYYKFLLWCRAGGEIMELPDPQQQDAFERELLSIRFKRTINGRIQIMSKTEMKKLGIESPNKSDAIALTFLRPDGAIRSIWGESLQTLQGSNSQFDKFSPLGD